MKGKIIIYKDGSHHYHEDGITREFENDENYLCTIDLSKLVDYKTLNK